MFRLAEWAVTEWGAQQKPEELADLGRLVTDKGCRSLLEVGTFAGGTARFFSELGLDVDALDLDLSHVRPGADRVRFHRGRSMTAEIEGRWDAVLIDGDHSPEGIAADWERFLPVANKLVVVHDIVPHWPPENCAVNAFWLALTGLRVEEVVCEDGQPWGGFGVVFLNEEF